MLIMEKQKLIQPMVYGIKYDFKGEIMEHDPLAQEKKLNEVPGQVRN